MKILEGLRSEQEVNTKKIPNPHFFIIEKNNLYIYFILPYIILNILLLSNILFCNSLIIIKYK